MQRAALYARVSTEMQEKEQTIQSQLAAITRYADQQGFQHSEALTSKAHTVGRWKKDEDWESLILKIERRAAEQLAERIATERVSLNERHFKGWSVIFNQIFEKMTSGGLDGEQIRNLERLASVLERTQKGQRLARGLSLDGKSEEQLRAEFEAEGRSLIDFFIDLVREKIPDERVRDEIARAMMDRLPLAEEVTS